MGTKTSQAQSYRYPQIHRARGPWVQCRREPRAIPASALIHRKKNNVILHFKMSNVKLKFRHNISLGLFSLLFFVSLEWLEGLQNKSIKDSRPIQKKYRQSGSYINSLAVCPVPGFVSVPVWMNVWRRAWTVLCQDNTQTQKYIIKCAEATTSQ